MANSKGNQKSKKEKPSSKKKGGDADAIEEPIESGEGKGPKEVDGKKNGKNVEAKKTSPGKDGKQDELESQDQEVPPGEQPNVDPQETEEQDRLCPSCIEVKRRWPPPPYVDPNPRDPSLLYPGDVDPEFQPCRGDILVIHPGLHMGLADLHRQLPKDGFVSCYDGSPTFEFAIGDLVLRMGTYADNTTIVEPTKKEAFKGKKNGPKKGEEKKGPVKGKKEEEKKAGSSKKGEDKKRGEANEEKAVMEASELPNYNPYEKLELYTCSGFITAEELARLKAERLAIEAEKERLESESKKKGKKGKMDIKDNKTKNDAKGDGKKKTQGGDDKKKETEKIKDGKKGGPKVPPLGKEEVEKKSTTLQDETIVESGEIIESRPKPKWRYLGSQMQLDMKSQGLLGKQCPGLTYFYRRYMTAGTRCDMHSLTPILGEILINIGWLNNWYRNLEKWQKEENNYKSLVRWFTPGLSSREELVSGMILLRPLVGRELDKWVGWGLDGKKLPPPFPQPLIPQDDNISTEEPIKVVEEEEVVPPPKCDCHRKSPCPKPPCPCHLYDPCPKLPDCQCIYCNPLPRKPKEPKPEEKAKDEEEKERKPGKRKGKNKNEKGKGGKSNQDEQPTKGGKKDGTKQEQNKAKSKDGKDSIEVVKNLKGGKGKDGKLDPKTKEGEGTADPQEELEIPKKPYVWGAVEMYLFFGKEEGWEYWGRSDRICDTPYPLPSENAKPKFLHVDDRLKVEETLEDKIGNENEETQEINKEKSTPGEKSSKKFAKDDVNKKLQQEESVKKKTKKS
ncbi:unnamed protein product [Calypogeia fissa]